MRAILIVSAGCQICKLSKFSEFSFSRKTSQGLPLLKTVYRLMGSPAAVCEHIMAPLGSRWCMGWFGVLHSFLFPGASVKLADDLFS